MTNYDPQHDDLPDWETLSGGTERSPASIEPAPATMERNLRGRRVIIGLPGLGWRGDLRADTTVIQASRTYVPVLPEQEWYRAEAEQTEVFAPLVPVERVWVERIGSGGDILTAATDLVSRLVSLDTPPLRMPRPAREVIGLTGRRVVRMSGPEAKAAGDQRDLRAVTEAYTSADGDICVRVCAELDWYRWAWSGQPPRTLEVPIHLLWIE